MIRIGTINETDYLVFEVENIDIIFN